MTLEKIIKYLKTGELSLYKMAREGKFCYVEFTRKIPGNPLHSRSEGCICKQFGYLPNWQYMRGVRI